MSKENATGVVKTIVNGVVNVANAGVVGLLGYELMTRILGGTSIIGTIIRTRAVKSATKSIRENIPKVQWTEDTAKELSDEVDLKVETIK